METYKEYLFGLIDYKSDTTAEAVDKRIKNNLASFTVNRNEEGKMHSRYLGDRYEPSIVWNNGEYTYNYYLFDGDIKDCLHPFRIIYCNGEIISIRYYSSERIQNGEPNSISLFSTSYNRYDGKFILDEYESKFVYKVNNFKDFTSLCEEIVEPFKFKVAD